MSTPAIRGERGPQRCSREEGSPCCARMIWKMKACRSTLFGPGRSVLENNKKPCGLVGRMFPTARGLTPVRHEVPKRGNLSLYSVRAASCSWV